MNGRSDRDTGFRIQDAGFWLLIMHPASCILNTLMRVFYLLHSNYDKLFFSGTYPVNEM